MKMELFKVKSDKELFYYFLKNGQKKFLYRHKYYDDNGKRAEKKKGSFNTEKEALKALINVKADLLNGKVSQVENSELTVGKWLYLWYETYSHEWEVTTRIQRKDAIDNQMNPMIGKYNLLKLDRPTYIRSYINPLLNKYKPSTVMLFHRLFKIAINAAVEDEIIPRNRFNKIKIDQHSDLNNFLTPQELNVFLDVTKQSENITNYSFVLTLAYTGMRLGEALGLKWRNIDFLNKTLTIECTRDRHGDRTPKTKNSYRTIPIDDLLINQLLSYQRWCIEQKFSNGMRLDKENDYIFISHQGATPLSASTITYIFQRLYKTLKQDDIHINKISAHGLRHTHATILINNNVPAKTIADRLGNTVKVLYSVYSHSFKELEDKAVSVFNESLIGAKIGAK